MTITETDGTGTAYRNAGTLECGSLEWTSAGAGLVEDESGTVAR
jgi:hypothetical protein